MAKDSVIITAFDGEQSIADQVARLHLNVRFQQRQEGENLFIGRLLDSQEDLSAMDSYYIEPGGNFFIAQNETSGEIAGFIGLKKVSSTEGQLKRMAVMPDYRRRGIGTRLVLAAVDWAKQAGFKKLTLATYEKEKAINIYKSAGFKIVDFNPLRRDHHMELNLD